jgi:protocatechuate 3,4-dioxygenase beta subunit
MNRSRSFSFIASVALVFICLAAGVLPARGQTAATLTGTISDVSGGALPGVQITLQHTSTSLRRTSVTTADGRFVFAGVPAGEYELRAEFSGF